MRCARRHGGGDTGAFAIDPDPFAMGSRPDAITLARSSILLLFAFAGIEAALVPGGEVKDPAPPPAMGGWARQLLLVGAVISMLGQAAGGSGATLGGYWQPGMRKAPMRDE